MWAKSQGITTSQTWREISSSLPSNIPASPSHYYKNEWKGFGSFLGTGRVANQHKKFATYHEAQKWAQEQKITSSNQWTNKKDRPSHIPSLPEAQYKSQWKGWASFLGLEKTIPKKKKIFLSYKKAQQWAKEHDIATVAQWYAYSNKPKSLPYHPDRTYKNEGWVSWSHFLGNNNWNKGHVFVSYEEASRWAQENKLTSQTKWHAYKEKPDNIPSSPQLVYQDKWQGWPEFLKNGQKSQHIWASYEEASKWAQQQGIQSSTQWRELGDKLPKRFPRKPDKSYKNEWIDWARFLNSNRKPISAPWASYEQAKQWAQDNNITTATVWKEMSHKRPSNIPSNPYVVYKEQWKGWREFFCKQI